jgi:hypothetical protein
MVLCARRPTRGERQRHGGWTTTQAAENSALICASAAIGDNAHWRWLTAAASLAADRAVRPNQGCLEQTGSKTEGSFNPGTDWRIIG